MNVRPGVVMLIQKGLHFQHIENHHVYEVLEVASYKDRGTIVIYQEVGAKKSKNTDGCFCDVEAPVYWRPIEEFSWKFKLVSGGKIEGGGVHFYGCTSEQLAEYIKSNPWGWSPSAHELSGISDDTFLQVTTDGESLTLTPVDDQEKYRNKFEAVLKDTIDRYGEALKKIPPPESKL